MEVSYRAAADPARAPAMTAYMRGQFPYLGIPTPLRRALDREVTAGVPRPAEDDLADIASGCWELAEREFQYFATDYLRRHVLAASVGFVDQLRALIVAKSWWDTVDALATGVVGPMVAASPALTGTMDEWLEADDIWLVRTAILHQLLYRARTDTERLWCYCLRRGDHPDFFIRKAIGWALREYSKSDGDAVEDFVRTNAGSLSPLTRREALKWLNRARALR